MGFTVIVYLDLSEALIMICKLDIEWTTEEVIKSMKEESLDNLNKEAMMQEGKKGGTDIKKINNDCKIITTEPPTAKGKLKLNSFISSIISQDSEGKTLIPLSDKSMEILKGLELYSE